MAFQINLVNVGGVGILSTINLADGVNYSIDDEEGTFTAFMVAPKPGISRVTETITVNVLGGTSTNPAVRRKVAADNLNNLTAMLRQIETQQAGQLGYVNLEIVPPASAPTRKFSAALLEWLPEVYLPDVVTAENLPSGAVNRVTITYTRRAPWLWEWLNDNEVAGTQDMSLITTPALAGVTRSGLDIGIGAWGGLNAIQLTKTGAGAANTYLNLGYACTNGVPVTFSITTSFTNITQLDILLVSLGPVTGRSNLVSATIHADPITNGTRFVANLTPTFTGTLYPYFQIYGPAGATVRFTEPMFQLGTVAAEDAAWHPSQAIETRTASASAANYVPANPVFAATILNARPEFTPSPTAMNITYPGSYLPTSGLVMIADQAAPIVVNNLPTAASLASGFTSVAEVAGNRAMNNNVLRCTATAATTYVQPLNIFPVNAARCVLAIQLRNNAASNQWVVSLRVKPQTISTIYYESRFIFPIADTQLRTYLFGEITAPFNWGQVELVVTSNAASGTIDFNCLAWAVVDEDTCVMTHSGLPVANTGINIVPSIQRGYAVINVGDVAALDDPLFMTKANSLSVVYLAPSATTWSPPTGNIGYSLTRYSAAEHVS